MATSSTIITASITEITAAAVTSTVAIVQYDNNYSVIKGVIVAVAVVVMPLIAGNSSISISSSKNNSTSSK